MLTDIGVMMAMSAFERTQQQFLDMISRVGGGLRVGKVWMPKTDRMWDSLIECVVDE